METVMNDKRTGQEPIPADLKAYLNDLQVGTLKRIEEFGWHLWFIRRPLFQDVKVVVADKHNAKTAVLEEDGTMNKGHDLSIRF